MLNAILNWLKTQVERIIAEVQAGFRPRHIITEQLCNLRILMEKCLQRQQELHHALAYFKKGFDSVWHEASWVTMKSYSINSNINLVTKILCEKATSAFSWTTTLGAGSERQLELARVVCYTFLSLISSSNHERGIWRPLEIFSIRGRPLTNLRFFMI